MANLRIIHSNAADRATSLAASTTAGSLAASNMQNDFKGRAHRSEDTSVVYTLTWDDGESVAGAGLPATNLTADATIQLRGYSDTGGSTLIADTGVLFACAGANLENWDWTGPLNANAFVFGGLSKAEAWFDDHYFIRRLEIEIVDDDNAAGYIDCARLVVGAYFSPAINAQFGAIFNLVDTSEPTRNDAGDKVNDQGIFYDEASLDLKFLDAADRAKVTQIIRGVGQRKNVYLSLLPEDDDAVATQDHIIYGSRKNRGVAFDSYELWSNKIEMEGW